MPVRLVRLLCLSLALRKSSLVPKSDVASVTTDAAADDVGRAFPSLEGYGSLWRKVGSADVGGEVEAMAPVLAVPVGRAFFAIGGRGWPLWAELASRDA